MTQASPPAAAPKPRGQGLSDHNQVGVSLAGVGGVLVLWALFWPVPTEVEGMGVLIYPNNAGILNARAGGFAGTPAEPKNDTTDFASWPLMHNTCGLRNLRMQSVGSWFARGRSHLG